MSVKILLGDCREVLKSLPADSVHCCVTSPPYWGLRSYLPAGHPKKPLEIGSEPTVHEWVATMVEVFREVRRVLRPDGTCWVNLGDSYAPDKNLIGQPWRAAFALQADGWWLRQEIIWSKKNPMPESIRDRFTKAHEHVFLLTKSERYYFDFDAVQEPASENTHQRRAGTGVGFGHGYDEVQKPRYRLAGNKTHKGVTAYETGDEKHRTKAGLMGYDARMLAKQGVGRRQGPPGNPAERKLAAEDSGTKNNGSFDAAMAVMPATRNPRSVRHLASEPFRGAHYATYPPALIEPFILAGCPEGGTVLDPFGGSGTTGLVADRHHRNAILIDLDERNVPMATERISGEAPLFAEVE
jgi:DNA modification methylase